VARQLIALGFDAAALQGGYAAWRATQPVEPKAAIPIKGAAFSG
jgi:rhodanese-related sulfurtransferase